MNKPAQPTEPVEPASPARVGEGVPGDGGAAQREHSRRLHDLVNFVLAVRLRVDAARTATTAAGRSENLDAIDACLDRIVDIARDLRGARG